MKSMIRIAGRGKDGRSRKAKRVTELRESKADAVVMLKLDRMFRNAGDCLTTVERWEKSGVALHVIDLGGNAIDTTSAAGRFMLVVLAGAAEMERNLTRERTRSAMAVKKSNGQRVGTVPYGYDLADDGDALIPNESEQAVIAHIRTMRSRGIKLQEIAEALIERGVSTKTGKRTAGRISPRRKRSTGSLERWIQSSSPVSTFVAFSTNNPPRSSRIADFFLYFLN